MPDVFGACSANNSASTSARAGMPVTTVIDVHARTCARVATARASALISPPTGNSGFRTPMRSDKPAASIISAIFITIHLLTAEFYHTPADLKTVYAQIAEPSKRNRQDTALSFVTFGEMYRLTFDARFLLL